MKRWLVKEVLEFTKVIEVETKEEALEAWSTVDAGIRRISLTAREVREEPRQGQ